MAEWDSSAGLDSGRHDEPTSRRPSEAMFGLPLLAVTGLPLLAVTGILALTWFSGLDDACGGPVPGCASLRNAGTIPVTVRAVADHVATGAGITGAGTGAASGTGPGTDAGAGTGAASGTGPGTDAGAGTGPDTGAGTGAASGTGPGAESDLVVAGGERVLVDARSSQVRVDPGQCLVVGSGPLWDVSTVIDRTTELTGAWHPIDDWGARVQLHDGECPGGTWA